MSEHNKDIKILIDGLEYMAKEGDNFLHAALSIGHDLPYFCWHPALGSVGACRQCAVKQYNDENDEHGRIVMACMTPCKEGARFSIKDKEASDFRAGVVEWLMVNHPHDCPVCEEGGECHLQDMTVMAQHHKRRYRFTKRTHRNQDLGPFINHEMNRCISCYRCVRYYRDYAGGDDLGVFGAHDNVYFGRHEDGALESEFSGNLVEVCPTGVFTDRTLSEHYTRKWDLQHAPQICTHCSVGCNISTGERYGSLRRVVNRYHGELNGYFLCDRGRFGYEYVNREDRPRRASINGSEVAPAQALQQVASWLQSGSRLFAIGSPRASVETNFALAQLVQAAGQGRYSHGLSAAEHAQMQAILALQGKFGQRAPTIKAMEAADAVVVLGEDVTQNAARVALAIRQANKARAKDEAGKRGVPEWQAISIQQAEPLARYPVYVMSHGATRLGDIASDRIQGADDQLAQAGNALARVLGAEAPAAEVDAAVQTQLTHWAETLRAAKRPLIVCNSHSVAVLAAATELACSLQGDARDVQLALLPDEANSMGTARLGGEPIEQVLAELQAGDVLWVAENDLSRRVPAALLQEKLEGVHLVLADHLHSSLSQQAEVLLPAATSYEADGSFVNYEGRAQRFFQTYDPAYMDPDCSIREGWRWVQQLVLAHGDAEAGWAQSFDDLLAVLAAEQPQLAGVVAAAPGAQFRQGGQKIARAPHRSSGRTAMRANLSVHEPQQPSDTDSALNYSMEGFAGPEQPTPLLAYAWSPGWNSVQSFNKFQDEVGGALRQGDPGILLPLDESAQLPGSQPANAVAPEAGALQLLALPHIFSSDELAARAQAVHKRMPAARLWLHPDDASACGLEAGDSASFSLNDAQRTLEVGISKQLPRGHAGIVQGLPGYEYLPPVSLQPRLQEVEV